ncbi:hypothetical protein V5P93_003533 [Actinokineospora auranticolor]|uniref:Uncharacterized protein n=1 Tax=Actinokineospora auranticolor TaxID=155976 RepID=A0A2S6GPL5_9PSEU|nr:hypothetical protein [Actinokineospora auranticolor]PPK67195.1 hypothetical protein CLV40_108193 [Actinokineospora auranticolor]
MPWHPLALASALLAATLGGASSAVLGVGFLSWLFLGATAGFATSGST